MKKFKNLIKHIDLFGKPLFLNFDKRWNTFDTFCGGCSALILVIFLIAYAGLLINVMLNNA
jgi:hypothetical protein